MVSKVHCAAHMGKNGVISALEQMPPLPASCLTFNSSLK